MRTKHLFYTMALAGIFAACTNDEFLEYGAPQATIEGQERPTISDVTLTVGEADTRASWSGGFTFENGDVISALLMDENNTGVRYGITTNTDEWNKLTWLEKYHLVDYVHTNFPFAYDASKGNFASDCNMLEGNYFLTYPYICLDGNRQGRIDVAEQWQLGDEAKDRATTLAKNQRFVGYAQLKAGEGSSDFKAELVPILAPVRIAIKSETNMATDLHITKLVFSHPKLTGTLMVDPTRAYYGDPMSAEKTGWNLWRDYVKNNTDEPMTSNEGDVWHFNYANFLANQPATADEAEWKEELYYNERYGSLSDYDYVYNVDGEAGNADEIRMNRKPNTYYWDDAIRAAVQPMREFNNPEYATQYVELNLRECYYDENGKRVITQDYMTLKPSGMAANDASVYVEAIVMLPAFEGDEEPLNLTIYTKEGIIKDINLAVQHQGVGSDLRTSGILDRVDPTDKEVQRIEVVLDNPNVLQFPTDVVINNEDDLRQWVEWLNADTQHTGNKNPIATFTNDITIDDELAAAIRDLDESYILSIRSDLAAPGNNLRIAVKDLTKDENGKSNADILEYLDVNSLVTVEVMDGATLNMTDKSYNIAHEISAIPGYPEDPDGQLKIEIAEGGTLNIVSNDKHAIQGGFDNTSKPVANRTEVKIHNLGGVINIANLTEVLGINIVNEGEMNVANTASLYFAPESINTIKGIINVEGLISGTVLNNFVNAGVINNGLKDNADGYTAANAPKIYNVINAGNEENKMPGIINIWGGYSKTDLSANTGIVDYHSYLTDATKVHFNNTMSGYSILGTYKYAGPGMLVSELTDGYVTDAVITEGEMETDEEKSTLINLTVKNGAVVMYSGTYSNSKLQFADYSSENSIVLEAGAKVDNVQFYNIAIMNVLIDGSMASGTAVTFDGQVAFYNNKLGDKEDVYSGLYFKSAKLELLAKADSQDKETLLKAGNLKSIDGSKSDVINNGVIMLPKSLEVNGYDDLVTVHINLPIFTLEGGDEVGEWTEAPFNYMLDGDGITTLKQLAQVLSQYDDASTFEGIWLNAELDMSLSDNKDYVSVLEGKYIRIQEKGYLIIPEPGLGLNLSYLAFDSNGSAISCNNGAASEEIFLTVDELHLIAPEISAYGGNIRINGSAIAGTEPENVTYFNLQNQWGLESNTMKILTTDASDLTNNLELDLETGIWVK